MSLFEEILLTYPSAPWDWSLVSLNSSVSFQFILDHSELPWVPKYVSRNPNITESDVSNRLEYPWDYEGLSMNPNLSLDFFDRHIIKPDVVNRIDWHLLSSNPSITMIDVINNPKYEWNDRYLSANPNLTSNYILNEGKDRSWFIPFVSSNPGITARDIFKSTLRTMFEWDYKNLSANINLPIVYVNDNIGQEWNYHTISAAVSFNDLHTFHQIKWDGHGLSLNPNITLDYIKSRKDISWHYPSLMMNPSISIENILTNYEWVSTYYKDSRPIEQYLSSNPTITRAWIKRNRGTLDWKRLSSNPLKKK